MSAENVEVVRSCLDAWSRDDLDAGLLTMHPEAELVSSIAAQVEGPEAVWRGRAGIRRFWEEWRAVWKLRVEIAEFRDLGDVVVALGHIQARGKTSGVQLESPVAYVCELDQGLIRKIHAYLDQGEALEAAGLGQHVTDA
jgi:ketosteroid isomerase-like protein